MKSGFDDGVVCEVGQSHLLAVAVDALVGQDNRDIKVAASRS